jgi:hypothetical protein
MYNSLDVNQCPSCSKHHLVYWPIGKPSESAVEYTCPEKQNVPRIVINMGTAFHTHEHPPEGAILGTAERKIRR